MVMNASKCLGRGTFLLLSFIAGAAFADIAWDSAVTSSSCYTNGANWVGGIAPTDGTLGVFERTLGDVTVTFPSSGIRESSSTKVCLRNGKTDMHTISFDLTSGGYWVKTLASTYGVNSGGFSLNDYLAAESQIFGINNAKKIDSSILFSFTNTLMTWTGNQNRGYLTISGGELNFYDPEGIAVGSNPPFLASGGSLYEPIDVQICNGASIRVANFDVRANGGNNLVRLSEGASLFVAQNLQVNNSGAYGVGQGGNSSNNAKAGTNRFEVIGAEVTVGGSVGLSMGSADRPFQRTEFVVSNSTVTAGASFNPCGGVCTNETLVLIGGESTVSVVGVNVSSTAKTKNAGNRSRIEIGGTSVFSTPGGNVLLGRDPGPGSEQRWVVKENATFLVTAGSSGGFIGYNDTANGCVTGIVELVDNAQFAFEAGDLSLGYSSASGSSCGRLSLCDNAVLKLNVGGLIRVGRTAGCYGRIDLNGGEIHAKRLYGMDGVGVLSADGGLFESSLATTSASDAAITALSVAELGSAGLCFSNDVNSVVSQAFTDKGGAAGLFAKSGSGALTVLADSTHARTEIRGGKIVMGTGVTTFGRNLTLAGGVSGDFSAAGLEVESLSLGDGASLTMTAGNPISVTTAGGLALGDGITITLTNPTSAGTFTLFETVDGLSAADLAKLKVVSAESDYFYTLSLDGTNVRLVTEYHAAAEKTWTGSTSGAWSLGGNWSGNTLPYPNDTATFGDSATTKAVTVDSDARVGTASFSGSTSLYSLAGSGSLSGDLAISAGTLTILSPSLFTANDGMILGGGTLEGDAEGLSISRSLTTFNSTYPFVMRATKDMTLSTALDTTKGGFLKLGAAKLSLKLPAGSHKLTPSSGGGTGNLTGQPALDEYGNMTGWGGCVGINVFDGTLEISGTGSAATTLNLTRAMAVGSRCTRSASPALVLRNLTVDTTGSMMVSVYTTQTQVSYPASVVLADDVLYNVGTSFYLGYHDTQRGVSYLTVSNSTLAVAGGCWIPESAATDFSGTSTVFVCRGGRIVSTSTSADASKGFHFGKCRIRIEDGGEIDGGGLMPITFDRANKDSAEILALRGGVIRATGFLGANTNYVTSTSSVTAGGTVVALDGGTLELVAGGISQSANPDRNYFRLDEGGGTISVGEGLVHRIAMPVKGSGCLTKAGAGVLRLARVVDRQADDDITELAYSAVQWTGGTCVAAGTLDLGGETVDLGTLSGGGVVSNGTVFCAISVAADGSSPVPTFVDATLATVRVTIDTTAGEPRVGDVIAVARIGDGVTTDVGSWRISPRLTTAAVDFVVADGVVSARVVDKRGFTLIVH